MDDIYCQITYESLKETGHGIEKLPLLYEIIRRLNEQHVPLTVVGKYRSHNTTFDVDYGQTYPHIDKSLKFLQDKKAIRI